MEREHPLDNPVWHSLNSRLGHLSDGGPQARKFRSDISPLCGVTDSMLDHLETIQSLYGSGDTLSVLQGHAVSAAPSFVIRNEATVVQLVNEKGCIGDFNEPDWSELGADHRFEMLELARLTKPGPFEENTYLLGGFIGVFEKSKLVAMAGERLKLPGYSEVSGVCTHPDHRGNGYAKSLSAIITRRILERNESAFIHAYGHNEIALTLYGNLGFQRRNILNFVKLEKI